jgi:tryptophanyl-tRNA synthetase
VFPEPEARLTKFARLRGLDGNRMSKSAGNTIWIGDSPEDIASKIKKAYTDPKKIRADDPGHPEGCVVWEYHRKFNADGAVAIATQCKAGELACVPDKKHLSQILSDTLAPIRERREKLSQDPDYVWDVIRDGDARAHAVAQETMDQVHAAMGFG